MSYDIALHEPVTGDVIELDDTHHIKGSNYVIGGTRDAWLSVTYNYSKHFRKVMGDDGIRTIYSMTGAESIPVIEDAISQLGDDATDDYWESTEGNAKKALKGLLVFAKLRPDGVWDGD